MLCFLCLLRIARMPLELQWEMTCFISVWTDELASLGFIHAMLVWKKSTETLFLFFKKKIKNLYVFIYLWSYFSPWIHKLFLLFLQEQVRFEERNFITDCVFKYLFKGWFWVFIQNWELFLLQLLILDASQNIALLPHFFPFCECSYSHRLHKLITISAFVISALDYSSSPNSPF